MNKVIGDKIFYEKSKEIPEEMEEKLELISAEKVFVEKTSPILDIREDYLKEVKEVADRLKADVIKELEYVEESTDAGKLGFNSRAVGLLEFYRI
ncbi:MAG: hypothetical protein J7L45_02035 [Candidatus Aenigmarchaeota archaeon]|nr:hypothetical protein [Candidatus Aenigmarchaeota archaeon]